MAFILKYLKKYKFWILLNFICVFGFALVELGIPTLVAEMIDQGISFNDKMIVYRYGLILVCISIIGVLGVILLGYCSSKISTRVTQDMRNDIFQKASKFSAAEMNYFGVSSMITRTNQDAYQVQLFINVLLRTALLTPVMMIASFVMTFRASISLSMIILATIPIIVLGVLYVAKKSGPISTAQQATLDDLNLISRENLSGVKVIRAFKQEDYENKRFYHKNNEFANHSKSLFTLMMLTSPLFYCLMNIASLLIYLYACFLIDGGQIQVGQLVAFMDYLFHAMLSVMLFCNVFMQYPRANVSSKRMQEILKMPISIKNEGSTYIDDKALCLTFDKVSFAYEDGEEAILKDISFEVKQGETIAFVGSTGSGKSTLIQLVPRLYDVSSGHILLNGQDIREYDLYHLRDLIGFIRQKPFLFAGTIRDNVKYGNHDASEEEMIHACKVACAYDFIMNKEHGFDSEVVEGATNLSGGQKQRLSIARALLKESKIYIFDDSFSALDYKTDACIREALKEEMKDKIMMIVAQRISTIMNADHIVVLDEGKVVGMGTHQELLKNCQIYQEIAYSQLSEEELNYAKN